MLAVARKPPRKEYLLLLAQPPITTPYTTERQDRQDVSTPISTLAIWNG
jgi:hypothetical protein